MLIRAAVGGSASSALSNDSNLLALQKQLQDLEMADAVTEALAPKHAPADAVEAKKLVKDQSVPCEEKRITRKWLSLR
jgi:hypothetical protein